MASQKKYYYQFTDRAERVHVVEFWQNTEEVLVAEQVDSTLPPFIVERPELMHKFQVVRGSGCQCNLLSATDMKFYNGLYHVDPQEFMVKHYIDSVLDWVGYLNSEMYTEPYDINFNYQVSVTGNDGFALMDRFSFVQADGTYYEGIKSKIDIIKIILDKIALPYSKLLIALSTSFDSGIVYSILHASYVNCDNFYDEDKKPMSLREVLESILAPYGAHIFCENTNIIITDIHTIASEDEVLYATFTLPDITPTTAINVANVKAIADIGYKGTGQSIEVSGGTNRQVVSYSPYPVREILTESIIDLSEFTTVPAMFSTKDGYNYKTLEGNKYWEINPIYDFSLNPPTFELSYFGDQQNSNVYLRYPTYEGLNSMIASLNLSKYITITAGMLGILGDGTKFPHISINAGLLVKTKSNPYNSDLTDLGIRRFYINCRLKVGNRYFDPNLPTSWTTTPSNFYIETRLPSMVAFDNRFVNIGIFEGGFSALVAYLYSDPSFILHGDIELEIWSFHKSSKGTGLASVIENSTEIQEVWITDISINIKDGNNNEISDDDIEYIGLLDKTFQNEGEKIILTCGTDSTYVDRGKIMSYDGSEYSVIEEWTRNGQIFKIEELLLASLSSNYRAGYVTLSGMKLNNLFSLQNVITDTFLGAKRLMVKSANINYYDDMVECSLVEITPDELIIVKDPTIF